MVREKLRKTPQNWGEGGGSHPPRQPCLAVRAGASGMPPLLPPSTDSLFVKMRWWLRCYEEAGTGACMRRVARQPDGGEALRMQHNSLSTKIYFGFNQGYLI